MPPPAEPLPVACLVTGDDPSLVSEALGRLLAELTAEGGFVPVEELGGDAAPDEPLELGPVLDALATPPFLSDRRVVVLRGAERLVAAQAAELTARLDDPVEGNVLVVVATGRLPQSLTKMVKAKGRVIDASAGQGRARSDWLSSRIGASSLRFSAGAARRLAEHLGEEVARLSSILEMLESAYGEAARIDEPQLEPFLGEEGGVPPWDLTDAIDRGDGGGAVEALHRMIGPGGRHPLQLMSTLHRHFSAMLRLDGSSVRSADEAAATLKMSAFPARKVLEQARRLGHDRISRAIEVLAEADMDLRGRVGWPPELVMEVAVARLAQLGRSSAAPSASRGRSPRGGQR
jgi:DNA polymerase-3 subunit delta